MKKTGCCSKFGRSICKEFQWKKFCLTHYPVDDFFKSEWQKGARSVWWLLYRWCAAGFFIGAFVSSLLKLYSDGTFFIYLTIWGLILCMVTTTYGAVLATIWYFSFAKRVDPVEQRTSLKVFWFLHVSTLVIAIVITVMFWAFLYPRDPAIGGNPYNIMQHALNSAIMLFDHMVVAFPTRLMHFVYPFGIGIVYVLFTLVYYIAGGKDWIGNNFIYPILDWERHPGTAVLSVVGALFLGIVLQFLLFCLYKLKKFLHRECSTSYNSRVIPK